MTRLTSFGKHEGDLPGAPRTGNDLKMTSITIHRIAGGKLVEKWAEKDVLGFLQQIGVIPQQKHPGLERIKLLGRKTFSPVASRVIEIIVSLRNPEGSKQNSHVISPEMASGLNHFPRHQPISHVPREPNAKGGLFRADM